MQGRRGRQFWHARVAVRLVRRVAVAVGRVRVRVRVRVWVRVRVRLQVRVRVCVRVRVVAHVCVVEQTSCHVRNVRGLPLHHVFGRLCGAAQTSKQSK